MFCGNCGKVVSSLDAYCPYCNKPVEKKVTGSYNYSGSFGVNDGGFTVISIIIMSISIAQLVLTLLPIENSWYFSLRDSFTDSFTGGGSINIWMSFIALLQLVGDTEGEALIPAFVHIAAAALFIYTNIVLIVRGKNKDESGVLSHAWISLGSMLTMFVAVFVISTEINYKFTPIFFIIILLAGGSLGCAYALTYIKAKNDYLYRVRKEEERRQEKKNLEEKKKAQTASAAQAANSAPVASSMPMINAASVPSAKNGYASAASNSSSSGSFEKIVLSNAVLYGAPIMIDEAKIIADASVAKTVVKFKNVSGKDIVALRMSVAGFDSFDSATGIIENVQYIDFNAPDGTFFGTDKIIQLGTPDTRKAQYLVSTVMFSDNTRWDNNSIDWRQLPQTQPQSLRSYKNEILACDSVQAMVEFIEKLSLKTAETDTVVARLKEFAIAERMYGSDKQSAINYLMSEVFTDNRI